MDAVDTFLRRYPDSPIALDVLSTLDADEIRARVHELEPDTKEIFCFEASVGAVFGVTRSDGSRVAVKINKLFDDEAYFEELQRLQAALAESGFPVPRPVRRLGTTTVEEWLAEGQFRNAHDPDVRCAMARELARFVRLATATGIRPRRTFLRPDGPLWPKPHNVLFDFDATAAGAEWIDEIGRESRAIADGGAGAAVGGHFDWSAKHVRFDDALRATAVYDWDSVTVDHELVVVGTAAGSFTYTEELEEPVDVWPSTEESLAFIAEYEAAREMPFAADELASARAACVHLRAYAARCHHAVGGDARESGLAELAGALL